MLVDIPNSILRNKSINSTGKWLYAVILDYTRHYKIEYCELSANDFASVLGMDHLAVVKALKKLYSDGFVERREVLSTKNTKKYEYNVKELHEDN